DGREEASLYAVQNGQSAPSPNRVRISAMPNVPEAEPNENTAQATTIDAQAPIAFNGVIEKDGDQDWFKFKATAGQTLEFRLFARDLGSPLDSVVNVFKADGTHLGGNDDNGPKPDSLHVQQMPETGWCYVRVMDHL